MNVRLVPFTSLDTPELPALISRLHFVTEPFKSFGQKFNAVFEIRHMLLESVSAFDQTLKLNHSAYMASLTQIEMLLPEFRAYATAICASSADAEDLVQDAIERALRTDKRPTVLDELRPWMFRVIRNLHYDELRKRRVRREYLAAEKRFSDEAGTSDAARNVLIRMAFEKLPPDMREVLCLVDIMGLKYAEAAKVMNVANGTVMSRISRARKALLVLVEGPDTRGKIENSRR